MPTTPPAVIDEVRQLREQLALWDYHYYVLDAPLVPDTAWDAAFNRLKAIEGEHPEVITPDSPTQRVGGVPVAAFAEVVHPVPMLSLDNAMGLEDLNGWHDRLVRAVGRPDTWDYVAEPKIDGLALELVYEQGQYVQGSTRGDGIRGEDVTANVRTIRSVPLKLREPVDIVVRGEAFMTVDRFLELNERQRELREKEYQNPRNATAGGIRQLDPRITATRPIELFVYTVVFPERHRIRSHWEGLEYLRRLGFRTNPASTLLPTWEAVVGQVEAFAEARHWLNYWADGLVLKVNPLAVQEAAGW
ncbi:MAG TPA: hypothetical protein VEI97_20645, partial [bacterium]|nr:hypothetical protein [bacterium]